MLVHVDKLLRDVASGSAGFDAVPLAQRGAAKAAYDRLVQMILRCQVSRHGQPAIWAQQYDMLALTPADARNFEPASLATGESGGVLTFLLGDLAPAPAMRRAIESGTAWLRAHVLADTAWKKPDDEAARRLVASPGADLLWPRYIDVASGAALFGDRDRTVHDAVNDLSPERRGGYAWYVTSPGKALKAYERWRRAAAK